MDWFGQSISRKLISTIVAGSIVVLGATLYAHLGSSKTNQKFDQLLSVEVNNERLILNMLSQFKTQVQEWKNTLLRGKDTGQRDKYWGRFAKQEGIVQDLGKTLSQQLSNEDARNLVNQFLAAHSEMGRAYRKGYDAFVASGYDHTAGDKAVKGIDREPAKLLSAAAESIVELVSTESAAAAEEAEFNATAALIVLITAIALYVIFAALIVNRSIIEPSRSLIAVIGNISQGRLGDVIDVRRDDELGQLADASRRLQEFLKDVAQQLNETNQALTNAADSLHQATEGVSGRVHTAHDTTEHVASAMTEMSATSQEVASHAASAADAASQASDAATESSQTMQTAQDSMANLASQVENTVSTVKKLADHTNEVGTVLSVIRGIAEQTNLLALNAAIEAARAGEQGRGFAVVADEVRSLAQKTQQSTEEIEGIISAVQNGAKDTVEVMDQSYSITQESASLFTEASEKLNLVTLSVGQITDLSHQVATAAEEQTNVSEDITKTIVEMSDLVEQTASSAASTQTTAQELIKLASQSELLSKRFAS